MAIQISGVIRRNMRLHWHVLTVKEGGVWKILSVVPIEGEDAGQAIIRAMRECHAFGIEQDSIAGYGQSNWPLKDGVMRAHQPLCIVQGLKKDAVKIHLAFVVHVPKTFVTWISLTKRETTDHKWWSPKDLRRALEKNPEDFFEEHRPILWQACTPAK